VSASGKSATAARGRAASAASSDDALKRLGDAREMLEKAVVLTRERIQEAMDDAVERGRMTRDDAEQLVADLFKRGRKQTDEFRADIEQLVGRGRGQNALAEAGKTARKRVTTAAKAAGRTPVADRARREVDRARRAAGVGPTFPILGYEDLTAGQVTSSLNDLTPAELRKVRDYERRNANRKSVLNAVEKKLA
jgi:polyhydroxyalkanoate synthesis regulator phasin